MSSAIAPTAIHTGSAYQTVFGLLSMSTLMSALGGVAVCCTAVSAKGALTATMAGLTLAGPVGAAEVAVALASTSAAAEPSIIVNFMMETPVSDGARNAFTAER